MTYTAKHIKFEIRDKDIIKILDYFHLKGKWIRTPIAMVESFLNRLERNHSFLLAAGIAFNILLYIIPMLLVALYIVNMTFSQEDISGFLEEKSQQILPAAPMLKDMFTAILAEVHLIYQKSSLFGWIGIVSLLWLSSTLLSSLRSGLNTVFHISSPKTYFFYKIRDIFLILAIAILILISSFVSPMIAIVQTYLLNLLPDFLSAVFQKVYVLVFSLFNSFLLYYLLFRFVPNQKMPRMVRYISIFSSIILIEISRYFFALYIGGMSSYGKFYGTYAILASMAVWVYYLTFIILFSAELGKFIYDAVYGNSMEYYLKNLRISPKSEKDPM